MITIMRTTFENLPVRISLIFWTEKKDGLWHYLLQRFFFVYFRTLIRYHVAISRPIEDDSVSRELYMGWN